MKNESQINNFFKNKTIFITGGSGFLGKVIIEKLLRTCDIQKLFVLMRTKKNKNEIRRMKELMEIPLFEKLKSTGKNYKDKIVLISGDCMKPNLGISNEDKAILINEVEIIIHSAAIVRFEETLKTVAQMTIKTTKDLIKMAKEINNLKSFVFVSTAYSNCNRNHIIEAFYEPPISSEGLIQLLDNLNEEQIKKIAPKILGGFPNTYTFGKSLAEDYIRREGKDLPISIFRPSIIISSFKEPIPGWIDNYNGPIGASVAYAFGLLRTLPVNSKNIVDLVPVDFVANVLLAILWKTSEKLPKSKIKIFNYVSSTEAPLTWDEWKGQNLKNIENSPYSKMIWKPNMLYCHYKFLYIYLHFIMHLIPGFFGDVFLTICGKKPYVLKSYKRIYKSVTVLTPFFLNMWTFENRNVQDLWKELNKVDKELFEFSAKNIIWNKFFPNYLSGIRQYVVKDPPETIEKAKKKFLALTLLYNFTCFLFFVLILYLIL